MPTPNTKKLWRSKTFWANALALAALLVQHYTGYAIDADAQVSLLAGINILLRTATSTAVDWS